MMIKAFFTMAILLSFSAAANANELAIHVDSNGKKTFNWVGKGVIGNRKTNQLTKIEEGLLGQKLANAKFCDNGYKINSIDSIAGNVILINGSCK